VSDPDDVLERDRGNRAHTTADPPLCGYPGLEMHCMHLCPYVCVCMFICVSMRVHARKRERERDTACICVCVCMREMGRERETTYGTALDLCLDVSNGAAVVWALCNLLRNLPTHRERVCVYE
jgi:hypothetical protein